VSRTSDDALRNDLIERATDYVCKHGLSDLSLRPLAESIGSSPSLLLYHFGSKEALLMAIIKAGRARQHEMMRNVDLSGVSERESARALWRAWSAPAWKPLMQLFFEVYALALQDPSRFPNFLDETVDDWLHALTIDDNTREGRARATLMIAVFRGLLLDLCATGERARVNKAADIFFETLSAKKQAKQSHAAS
jgi:AcrR family transcriptional regulator